MRENQNWYQNALGKLFIIIINELIKKEYHTHTLFADYLFERFCDFTNLSFATSTLTNMNLKNVVVRKRFVFITDRNLESDLICRWSNTMSYSQSVSPNSNSEILTNKQRVPGILEGPHCT